MGLHICAKVYVYMYVCHIQIHAHMPTTILPSINTYCISAYLHLPIPTFVYLCLHTCIETYTFLPTYIQNEVTPRICKCIKVKENHAKKTFVLAYIKLNLTLTAHGDWANKCRIVLL